MSCSVACILIENEKVLLIKRKDIPVWVLPGGGIDAGESPEQAAIREMEEETGIKTVIVRKIAEYLPINRLARHTYFFEVKRISGSLSTGEETADLAFFAPHQLPKKLPPPYEEWIFDALLHSSQVIYKRLTQLTYRKLFKLFILHPVLVIRFILTRFHIHINCSLS